MFHLYSLKEPPPKRMCETINFANEVEATISSQESQPPPSQRQSVDSQRSCGDQYNRTIPTCGFQLSKKSVVANRIAHFNPRGFRNFPGFTIMSKAILCCVSFACNKMQNQIFELSEVGKSALLLKGF